MICDPPAERHALAGLYAALAHGGGGTFVEVALNVLTRQSFTSDTHSNLFAVFNDVANIGPGPHAPAVFFSAIATRHHSSQEAMRILMVDIREEWAGEPSGFYRAVKTVAEAERRRAFGEKAISALRAAEDLSVDAPTIFESTREALEDVLAGESTTSAFGDVFDGGPETLLPETSRGIPTGFSDLDASTGGFLPATLAIIAGRPGAGKTALLVTLANRLALKGLRVAFISLEEDVTRIAWRVLSLRSEGSIPLRALQHAQLSTNHRALANKILQEGIGFDIGGFYSAATIYAAARSHDIVFFDYLQFAAKHGQNRESEVAQVTRTLKTAAKAHDIPIVTGAQLNRESTDPSKPPKLHHLRESGSLENDADVVLAIHPDPRGQGEELCGGTLCVLKNRTGGNACPNGGQGHRMTWNGTTGAWEPGAPTQEDWR